MKRFLTVVIVGCLSLGFLACTKKEEPANPENAAAPANPEGMPAAPAPAPGDAAPAPAEPPPGS